MGQYTMHGLNLELTTCCPLHCPQCYCTLTGGKHLDFETAKEKLKEAAEHGVQTVHLSGGETMCYPHLFGLIEYASSLGIKPNVAISGYQFDSSVLDRLIQSGVNGVFISLNGSTKEINALTRDGYELALHAMSVIRDADFRNSFINWVMHSNNCADFLNVVHLAEEYHIEYLVVLAFKPDSRHELKSFPSAAQIRELAKTIRSYRGPVKLIIESCFSQLLAVYLDTPLFGNLNVGPTKGCRAGLYNYSINVDGLYSPCRHLDYFESWPSLDDYLANSPVIRQLRTVDQSPREPCASCRYGKNCRHCMAVNSKINGEIYIGNAFCEFGAESRT